MGTKEEKYEELRASLDAVDVILKYITILDQANNEKELMEVMPGLLESLGRYTRSDRSYLFEPVLKRQGAFYMTHEWCREGVRPTIEEMQCILEEQMPNWMEEFRAGRPVVSDDWEAEKLRTPEEYRLFDGQDIHSLIVIPIKCNQKFDGYIGLDNPEQSMSGASLRLLSSVGGHLGSLKQNLSMRQQLEEKQRILQKSVEAKERQQAQLEAALAEAKLNNEIISSISKIYWLIYRMNLIDGTYEEISAGQEMHHLTGKRGIISEAFKEARETVVAAEHQELMKEFLDTATLAERLRDTESIGVEYHAENGSWHLARFIVKKRDASGKVTHVLYVTREINRQKQQEIEYKTKLLIAAEEAQKANLAKTDFLRRMSHDIRTPINGIRGMVSIANHYPHDLAKQQECRDKVMEASGFLLDLINNVLDMNKLESGSVILERKPFELFEQLNKANSIVEMTAQEKGVQLIVKNAKVRHSHLIGSPLHFQQILHNIAGNAVKYNRTGGKIVVTCEELETDAQKAVFRLTCSDTGRGMSETFLKHAFEPFSQEGSTARTAYMGTGLGLSITKQLVELMGGSIEVESKLNVGTMFVVLLPFEIDTQYEENAFEAEKTESVSLEGMCVLLAEDNELNMEIAEFFLKNAGMNVTKAWNGKEAVDFFAKSQEGTFDFILMDVMMPVMDGLEATRQIRQMNRKDAKQIPIFAMTANAFQEDRKLMDTIRNYFAEYISTDNESY